MGKEPRGKTEKCKGREDNSAKEREGGKEKRRKTNVRHVYTGEKEQKENLVCGNWTRLHSSSVTDRSRFSDGNIKFNYQESFCLPIVAYRVNCYPYDAPDFRLCVRYIIHAP